MAKKSKPAPAKSKPTTQKPLGVAKSSAKIQKATVTTGAPAAKAQSHISAKAKPLLTKKQEMIAKKKQKKAVAKTAAEEAAKERQSMRVVHVGLIPKSETQGKAAGELAGALQGKAVVGFKKEKVLVLSSRGIVYRYRHLMEDIVSLLPHSKKEPKVDVARGRLLNEALSELMDLRSCSLCLFFEMRKQRDLYLWLSKGPAGPSVKFLVSAVHTMEELKLTGNHLKGSRPFLTFSPSFDRLPFLSLLKELFIQTFATPKGHRKSKPFYDHVLTFTYLDNRIWFRNYQMCIPGAEGASKIDEITMEKMSLVEVGPRFCLNPIRVFSGTFGGPTLYENPHYISPNKVRVNEKRKRGEEYREKVQERHSRETYKVVNALPVEDLAHVWDADG
ncbi:hypothetical protein CLOP_g4760 [Closterium sp. NIES-67]|nr:hypothetical protein CLOP_g4760 [Closterium sp. NIES-67]